MAASIKESNFKSINIPDEHKPWIENQLNRAIDRIKRLNQKIKDDEWGQHETLMDLESIAAGISNIFHFVDEEYADEYRDVELGNA